MTVDMSTKEKEWKDDATLEVEGAFPIEAI